MRRTWWFRAVPRLVWIMVVLLAGSCGSPAPSANDLTFFSIGDDEGTIGTDTVEVVVPGGTNLQGLVATFQTTGKRVEVAGVEQISGQTPNDFTAPVTYTVIAGNGDTHLYTVTVTRGPSSSKDLTSFAFLDATNPALTVDVTGSINGGQVFATVPFGTDVGALVATFTHTGTSVTVGGVAQTSGTTPHSFASPVVYRVTAADGSTRDYTVMVMVAGSSAKDLTAFAFLDAANAALTADVTATINGTQIAATVPFGTNVTALVATFSTTGARVLVGTTPQASGVTANSFASPVQYTVEAQDGSTKTYSVTVTIAPATTNDITAFSFLDATNTALSADVTGTINGTQIAATVPFGTDVTALVATFAHDGVSVTVGGTPQVSGTTANSFASPVQYVVTAGNATTKTYTVTVTIAANPAKDITAFSFLDATNPALSVDVTATINNTAITATVPFGTDVTALVATFTTTGAMVQVGATPQASGITANSFAAPVQYVVTAADSTTKTYTVTVTVAPSPAKDITAFSFLDTTNTALSADVTATINNTAIAATVPFGTNVSALVATFTTTGLTVQVGAATQASGITPNDFTNPVMYVVTAADGSMKTYTVTVTIAPGDAKDITAFAFLDASNTALSIDVTATISGTQITAYVPIGTDRSALVATFSHTGAGVAVGGTAQASGITANDFGSPVTYVVTALDNSTKSYTVTVMFPRRFAMPHVRTSASGAASPITTVLRAFYAGMNNPSSATVTVRIFNQVGGTAVCNPCTKTIDAADRSHVLDFAALFSAAGVTAGQDAYAVIEVTGDSDRVVVSGTTETRPGSSTNVIPDVSAVVEQTATGPHKLFIGPGEENNNTFSNTAGGFDTRLTFLHLDGAAGAPAQIALKLFNPDGSSLADSAIVCNPSCTFNVGTGFSPRVDQTVHALRFAVGGTGTKPFLATADVSGAGAASVIVIAEREQGTTTLPTVVSRSPVPVHSQRSGSPTTQRFVDAELRQNAQVTQILQITDFANIGVGPSLSATVEHRVYNTATGAPQLGNNGQPICNPPCGGTIGMGFFSEQSTLSIFGAPQGGVPAGETTFVVTDVNGSAAAGVFASQRTQTTGKTIETAQSIGPPAPSHAYVFPHILETTGTTGTATNSFDTTLFMTYTGGLGGSPGPGSGASVDVFLFDQTTGGPLQATGGDVCNPCTVALGTGTTRKTSVRIDDLITAKGGFDTSVKLGFGVVVVGGSDPDGVNMQGFITNAQSGPTDLAVFGFEPQPLAAAP